MNTKENDFVEIEFTGRITDSGEIFDTNIKEDAKDANLEIKEFKPFILSIGHEMLPPGFDKDIVGKEIGKEYELTLNPENAFGKRDSKLVRMVPTKHFNEQQINPVRGMQLSLDGRIARILSSSGGRTLVDLNNPLAGRKVTYKYKIDRIVEDEKEKIDALQDFLFKKTFDFEIKDEKIILDIEKEMEPLVKMFSDKFKEILGKELEANIIKEEKKAEEKKVVENEEKSEHESRDD